jgi:hypothetical protein
VVGLKSNTPVHRLHPHPIPPSPPHTHPTLSPCAPQGKEVRFKVVGLKPNTEYILCVKAIYDDGSFLWSDSKAYMTRL